MKITPSDLAVYTVCRRKWQLKKSGADREKRQVFASVLFSQALHLAAKKMAEMENPREVFNEKWSSYELSELPIVYSGNDSWATLSMLGDALLKKFEKEFPEQGIETLLAENRVTVDIDGIKLTLQPDIVGEQGNDYVVGDYKTSESVLTRKEFDDQLTAGALLAAREFDVDKVRTFLCNFVKSTEEIVWHYSERTKEQIDAFVDKIKQTAVDMQQPVQPVCGAKADEAPCKFCEYRASCHIEEQELCESLMAFGMEV
jgi:CRISPR/Cas system-associated exonuclease Cas4 (RecB family)